jgi:hypothetical protein
MRYFLRVPRLDVSAIRVRKLTAARAGRQDDSATHGQTVRIAGIDKFGKIAIES